MSNKAITWAYAQTDLRSGPKFMLVTLADMADQEHSCYPGVDMLMELTGFGRTAVISHLNALIEAGYITTERRNRKNGARTSNRYFLQLVPAENVQPENERTDSDPKSGFSENLSPESVDRKSGIRTAYKDEPKEEPKGEPSDQSLEGLGGLELKAPGDVLGGAFTEFWKIYPRHEAKKPAEAKFRKAAERTDPAVILAGARLYAEFVTAVGRSPEHILHPTTWLNQERWNDELAVPSPSTPGRSKPSVLDAAAAAHDELMRRQQANDRLEITA